MRGEAMDSSYPRLLDGIVFVPVEAGYVIDGGAERKIFTGRIPALLFGSVLPLLDGRRRTDEIAASADVPLPLLRELVSTLERLGLLHCDDDLAEAGHDVTPAEVLLRRSLPRQQADAVVRRWRAASVLVTGSGLLAELISVLLKRSGVGTVSHCAAGAASSLRADVEVLLGPGAGTAGCPWLPVNQGAGVLSVGPLARAPGGCCARCLGESPDARATVPAGLTTGAYGVCAAVVAGAVLRWLGGHAPSRVWRQRIEMAVPDLLPVSRSLTPRPDCPQCARLAPGCPAAEPAWSGEPNPLMARGGAASAKNYLTLPRQGVRAGRDSTHELAAMLGQVTGAHRYYAREPARSGRFPAATCPESTRIYLRGPDESVHYLDGRSTDLVRLAGPGPGGHSSRYPLRAVFTGDLAGTSPVFGTAARTLLCQDAGLLIAELYRRAQAVGWQVKAVLGKDRRLTEILELDESREVVTALVDLAPPKASGPGRSAAQPMARLLRGPDQAYGFGPVQVGTPAAAALANAALSGAGEIWPARRRTELMVNCLLYARAGDGGRPSFYQYRPGERGWLIADADPMPLGTYLEDRGITPAGLLVFCADPCRGRLPQQEMLLSKAAAAARLAQFGAAAAGLASGLFARLPGPVLAATMAGSSARYGILYGCAFGRVADCAALAPVVLW